MENTQEFLNALMIALVLAFTTLIILNLFVGLWDLWKQSGKTSFSKAVQSLTRNQEAERINSLPYLKPVSKIVRIKTQLADSIVSNTANNVDTESLAVLIQQLPQPRVRTAARRLGIPDKIDGQYQRLAVLRSHLQTLLLSQPTEVARVLNQLKAQ
ncbi:MULTISPECIES: hypothetical protein [unclassified Tolypothrix]|uniref:hypothetical protein n=1 Tax=unclassified Tolypothrix TaxID=2649714 RepID=UPI0005EAB69A|nr:MULTISPECIES: hypothetical protein [unclassified Tolypothrix]BAY93664.1 hypothetical protein NIES3275_57060 [Microchaete diplosiphon NIES-3275]EKE99534.1 hypothetical protein FDUTEX481_09794 [Tolypothrix sp. PCC 7601]MBE9081717.1 hypothetical protein [Tolypothrix sp. LEGE 11397]UYD27484.1 hypothetical protein HGR01_05185 [Tolypothrix sp. PCC 7712]UYD36652.1 hypothetical protein HG267_13525 [Tolypothrix sp. PCC 7601]